MKTYAHVIFVQGGDKNDPEMFDSVVYQGRICSVIWLDNDNILTSGPNGEAVSSVGNLIMVYTVCINYRNFYKT